MGCCKETCSCLRKGNLFSTLSVLGSMVAVSFEVLILLCLGSSERDFQTEQPNTGNCINLLVSVKPAGEREDYVAI